MISRGQRETSFQLETTYKLQREFNYILITNGRVNEAWKHNKGAPRVDAPGLLDTFCKSHFLIIKSF